MHVSKADAVQRVEIFTGTGRRRRWPAEVKARIVAESYASGETVSGVARRHGLTVQQLFGWRRQLRGTGKGSKAEAIGFVPVVVAPGRVAPARRVSGAHGEGAPPIVVEVGGASIRVPAGVDGGTLVSVLRALKAAT